MKIKYQFATETVEIEVDESWGTVLVELDRLEYNNDQSETRRHCSLEFYSSDDDRIPDDFDMEQHLMDSEKREMLHKAIGKLEPTQQALIYALYFQGISVCDYADRCGVSQPAITQMKKRALKKLNKYFA